MLNRIEVDVIDVHPKIPLIPYQMLPEPALPDGLLVLAEAAAASGKYADASNIAARERLLYQSPTL